MHFIDRCAISRKELKESDDVIIFPTFYSHPNEPEFVCCEGIALRSEFESWYLKDSVTKRVRDFWTQTSHMKGYLLILVESKDFLIEKSTIEKWIELFFLRYVFSIRFTETAWENFVNLMLISKESDINTMGEYRLSWSVDATKNKMVLQIRSIRKDTIAISMAEWLNLQELISAIK
jgi:hypothetical protein